MTAPIQPTPDPRILANLQRLKDAGAPDEALEAYLREEAAKPTSLSPGELSRRAAARTRLNLNDQEQAAAETPDYLTQVLGGISSLAHNIPGAERLQAGARSIVRGQPYDQALSDITGAEADAPAAVRVGNGVTGGAITTAVMPGGPAVSGGSVGLLSGLLDADNHESVGDRLRNAGFQGLLGAAAGSVADKAGTLARSVFAPSLGDATAARAAQTAAADAASYGAAANEGASAAHSPAVEAVLSSPDIKPYADMIQGSRKFAGADQGTILRETYKLMSKQQSGLAKRLADQGFDAATKLAHDNIGLAKQELMNAADAIMPSFRTAVSGHAELMGQKGAFDLAADAAKRLINGTHVTAKRLATQSPEAVSESLKQMREEAAKSALEGTLGRLKEYNKLTFNPLKLFGAGPMLRNAAKVAPQVGLLDQIAGTGQMSQAARAAIVSGLLSTTH